MISMNCFKCLIGLVIVFLSVALPAASEVVSSLSDLSGGLELDRRRIIDVQIDGTVWWSSDSRKEIILKDESAVVLLALDLSDTMPHPGDRLTLNGRCAAMKVSDRIRLSPVSLVDNDGPHPMDEKKGRIRLNAGFHPIRADWFNWEEELGLEVEYEGPGLERQRIPCSALFHEQVDSDGTTHFVEGLEYCCSGVQRLTLPLFSDYRAIQTGTSKGFDLSVRELDEYVGLQFQGYLQVPAAGEYTFYVSSDDGSRLFVGEPSFRMDVSAGAADMFPAPAVLEGTIGGAQEYEWVVIEGEVISFQHFPNALEMDLRTDRGMVTLKLAEDSEYSYTLLPGNRLRAAGVGRTILGTDGKKALGELYVARWDDLEQVYIVPRIWNEHPVIAIDRLTSAMEETIVHLQGTVERGASGSFLVFEDESGRIALGTGITDNIVHQSLDVLGRLGMNGSAPVLRYCVFRPHGRSGQNPGNLPLLTTNEQITQLSLEEAGKGYPVKIRGVVTSLQVQQGVVLQDSSRGIYVSCYDLDSSDWPRIGEYCEVEGRTTPFDFNPYFSAVRWNRLGKGRLPDPVKPTWDQLINGSMHCNYVELEGVVESIDDYSLTLLTHGGRIILRLNPAGAAIPNNSQGAMVQIRGCLLNDFDMESRRVVIGGISFDQHRIAIIQSPPIDPFSIPAKRVGELLQFDPQAGALQRVKVEGVLVFQGEEMSFLMDGDVGIRFVPAEPLQAKIGEQVEVVGFPDLWGSAPVLQNALVRRNGKTQLPAAEIIENGGLLSGEHDATLVQLRGVLLRVNQRHGTIELEMQAGLRTFGARIQGSVEGGAALKPGSLLELTGVYVGQGGNRVLGRPIDSFELLLPSDDYIRILSEPSWWTFRRLLGAVGLLGAVLAASLVWINLLHRKVELRTQELAVQIRKRQKAEHLREIEKERARLAHDLHDDLGSGLTEVNLLSMLAASPDTPADEKTRCSKEVNQLLSRMVLSLDEIVWAENPKNDRLSALAGYFGAHAQRLLEMAGVTCGLDMQDELPDCSLDSGFRRELFLAFKESITNIIKHAEARKAWLRISVQNSELIVIVSDDGQGIPPDSQKAGSDGLDNMKDRMNALEGSCKVRSEPGKGTSICLRAPIRKGKE